MLVGAAQVVVHGFKAVFLAVLGSPECAVALNRVAQGVGKVFWAPSMQPVFYGAAELDRSSLIVQLDR
jgi:hypothetical protein